MSLITPFPEAESPALERFALLGPGPVGALLGELRDRQTLVTLYYEDTGGFAVGHILEVDAGRETLILDCDGDAGVQRSIARAPELVVVGFLDSTKIQFRLTGAESVDHHGRAAFRLRWPAHAFRIQRRSTPRRHPPGGRPPLCRVPTGSGGDHEALRVLDIGIGGLALLATPPQFQPTRDQVLEPCYLDLPEVGQIGVTLKVRYLDAVAGEVGGRRCGCEFVDLTAGARRALQVYLDRLEDSLPPGKDRRAA